MGYVDLWMHLFMCIINIFVQFVGVSSSDSGGGVPGVPNPRELGGVQYIDMSEEEELTIVDGSTGHFSPSSSSATRVGSGSGSIHL